MIWAVWREIYRQDLCFSFNQWLLRVISVYRCLIFKVQLFVRQLWAFRLAVSQTALLLYQTTSPLSTPFFNFFSFLFPFFNPPGRCYFPFPIFLPLSCYSSSSPYTTYCFFLCFPFYSSICWCGLLIYSPVQGNVINLRNCVSHHNKCSRIRRNDKSIMLCILFFFFTLS